MNIVYWSPHLSQRVATVKAVLNSAISLVKYSENKCNVSIINAVGEWNVHKKILSDNNVNIIEFSKYRNFYNNLPKYSYLKSRASYSFVFIYCFFKLLTFLKKNKPNFFIFHLISSLPMTLLIFFSFETKFILRISGLPKMNIFRKYLWKLASKKIYKIVCPTKGTYEDMLKYKIFSKDQLSIVQDPIILPSQIISTKNIIYKNDIVEKNKNNYLLGIGRLSKQKNFKFLINNFAILKKKYSNLKLIILGDGEEKFILEKLIKQHQIENDTYLLGYKKNIHYYLENSLCFVLPSLWEDPGFVLIEAIYSNTIVLSSDCKNGPKEILDNGSRGYIYESNNSKNFIETFDKLNKEVNLHITKKILAKKYCKKYSIFSHYLELKKIIY